MTAAGEVVHASADVNPDLFWAPGAPARGEVRHHGFLRKIGAELFISPKTASVHVTDVVLEDQHAHRPSARTFTGFRVGVSFCLS